MMSTGPSSILMPSDSSKVCPPRGAERRVDSKPPFKRLQRSKAVTAMRSGVTKRRSAVKDTTVFFELKAIVATVKNLEEQVRFLQSRIEPQRSARTAGEEIAVHREQNQDSVSSWLSKDILEFMDSTNRKLENFQERISKTESNIERVMVVYQDMEAKIASANGEAKQGAGGRFRALRGSSISTEKVSKDDRQRYQEQIAVLTQRYADLEQRHEQVTKEYKSALQQNADFKRRHEQMTEDFKQKIKTLEETNKELKSSILNIKGEVEGSFTSTDETPAEVAGEYEKLFSQGRRNLVKVTKLDERTGRLLANDMFKSAYEECRQAVLQEMFKELFCHQVPDVEQSASSSQIRAQYGLLLHLKKHCIKENTDTRQLALKVVNSVSSNPDVSISTLQHDPKYAFAQNAVMIALKMVTIQPPMVIDCPPKFNDDLHIPLASHWCEKLHGITNLVYFRPVLYSTSEQPIPTKKGFVGNMSEHKYN